MKSRVFAILLFVAAAATPAMAGDEAFIEHLLNQLSCQNDPDPTATLLYLNREKRISLKDGDMIDSETCWAVKPQLEMRGMRFSHVCGSAEDPLLVDLFPKLYYRGPGTSAGTGLRLLTDAGQSELESWAKQELGDGPYRTEDAAFHEGKREVSCNNLWRR